MLDPTSLPRCRFRLRGTWLAAAAALAFLAVAGAAEAQSVQCSNAVAGISPAVSGQAFECSFVVAQGAGQAFLSGRKPYLVQLEVSFTSPGQLPRRSYAFWDGPLAPGSTSHRFVFRHIFPHPASGTTRDWTWTSVCLVGNCTAAASDPNLESSGIIRVSRYSGPNRLYTHGLLAPRGQTYFDDNGTPQTFYRLRHLDNQPFTFIGDTAWAAPVRAVGTEWSSYLASRVDRGVSIVQLGMPHLWMGPSRNDANGNPGNGPIENDDAGPEIESTPFEQVLACPTLGVKPNGCSYPVAEFWQDFEAKIAAANSSGIYVYLAGVMEPNRDGSVANNAAAHLTPVEARAFARYIGARLAGSYVIFSPSFDSPPITQSGVSLQSLVGNELVKVNPGHLVSNHRNHVTGTSAADYAGFHLESWLSFETVQSGFRDGTLNTVAKYAREMSNQISGSSNPLVFPFGTRKPAVNAEAIYDQGSWPSGAYSAYGARMAGYLSWLSGSFGYSWGIGGLWDWGSCGLAAGNPLNVCGAQLPSGFQNPAQGLSQTHANGQLQNMGNLLRAYELSHINAREQDRISALDPGFLEYQKPALARGSRLLAYLPHNHKVRIRYRNNATSTLYNPFSGKLWDPRTGVYTTVANGATSNVTCPTAIECDFTNRFYMANDANASDRVLVLQRDLGFAGTHLEVDAGRLTEGGDWGVVAQLVDGGGLPLSPLFLATSQTGIQLAEPAAAGSPATGFLVVWQADANGDGLEEVHGQRLDGTTLLPVGAAFQISPNDARAHRAPAVATDAAGVAVVAWQVFGGDSGTSEVWTRSAGGSLGAVAVLCAGVGIDCSQPKVAAGAASGLTLAWVEYDATLEQENVVYQRFAGTGLVATMAAAQVNTVEAPLFTLDAVAIDAATGASTVRYEAYNGGKSLGIYQHSFDTFSGSVGGEQTLAPAPPEL